MASDLFPFHEQDVPTIAAMAQTGAFECLDDIHVELPPHLDLDDIIRISKGISLTQDESAVLNTYAAHILTQGVDAKVLENRTAACRLLLLGLRGLPHDGQRYRAVLDKLQPLFKRAETRAYFLAVARHFYSFLVT